MPKKKTTIAKRSKPAPAVGLGIARGELNGTISRLNEDGSFSVNVGSRFIHRARLAPEGEWSPRN